MGSQPLLLSRERFRDAIFARDGQRCVFCSAPAADAHHIMERRLWSDGGYYLDNGASVCPEHHVQCETTIISVEAVRIACGIQKVLVPPHLYPDQPYDKWGNPILPNGTRMRGELFHDESVQKVLARGEMLDLFTHWVKYPRTHHLPWSESVGKDDRIIESLAPFFGRRVIVTAKMDGENTSLYRDHIHARSLDGRSHPSRDWAKNFWASIRSDIPEGWRVCAENLFAEHSIPYANLPSYLMGFSVWNDRNICLPWDETVEWLGLFGLPPVGVLYDGPFDETAIQALWNPADWAVREGYVMRIADAFPYAEFRRNVAKFVRKNHIQTQRHWMHGQPMKKNKLAK